ncbi:Uncharacterised protein [BD1-7 clade bacterium]|uniref:3-hydroxylacyl-ACP dehydratase n=1 Tax=BD1-7 clade bacterium TaxID=2029982 RepID=A0A5S9QMA2_9GAMM|nr:Uncharacterised protein [BD1-7 clade bacterium]CAA0119054.1 Uncharacterised protein [BD1-7 clade bacterium]
MIDSTIPIESLLPHADNMVLIDRLIECGENFAVAEVGVLNADRFSGSQDQVPSWIGIEYMAQTIAAMAGKHARRDNESVKAGLLLGTRRYWCELASFTVGETLIVRVKELLRGDTGLASFECTIESADGAPLAKANLNVFQTDQTIDTSATP